MGFQMPRLFIAIDMPDELRGKICELRGNLPCVRWTEKEQIHLTLRFIGDADEENFKKTTKSLDVVKFKPPSIEIHTSGFFPNGRRPSVFWLGCMENPILSKLKNDIDDVLEMDGLPRETRGFVPHITIARLKDISQKEIMNLQDIYKDLLPQRFTAEKFVLYSSVLTANGAIHTIEKTYQSENKTIQS